jgi:hypothetical protein
MYYLVKTDNCTLFRVLLHSAHFTVLVSNYLQWPSGLGRGSAFSRLLRLTVRIQLCAWMSVCCECCVLSDRYFCVWLITRLEDSY